MTSGKHEDFFIENFRTLANVLFALCMFASVTKLSFPVANLTDSQLLDMLRRDTNLLLNFIVAFIFLALYWIKFVSKLRHIERANNTLLSIWLVYLGFVCLYPFAENLLGNYPGSPVAQITFSALWAIIGFLSMAHWWYARQAQLVEAHLPVETSQRHFYMSLPEPLFALISIPLALYSDWAYYGALLLTVPANFVILKSFPESKTD
jgi:uncharacterized membrane protein